ncbi:MAG: hypothetical protein ABSC08_12390 [Bryobacteraceae bacterium]|jgi:hypothetical protein
MEVAGSPQHSAATVTQEYSGQLVGLSSARLLDLVRLVFERVVDDVVFEVMC